MSALDKRVKKRALEMLAITLKNSGCPKEAAMIIRNAFWQTITRSDKKQPILYEQMSLFQ